MGITRAERAGGFVRHVRLSYVHQRCGEVTVIGREAAEAFARHPAFCGTVWCCHCHAYQSAGRDGEFTWATREGGDTGLKVGT